MDNGYSNQMGECANQIRLNNIFRSLWEQHSIWTRSFIISDVNNLPDLQAVTDRLLRNPDDFGMVLQRFYGPEKASRFRDLLRDHLLIAADLVNAAKAGDKAKVDEARKKWYQNADDIAEFLSSINPMWSRAQWQKFMYDHLQMVENEATYTLTSKYAESIAEFDKLENQALKMADYMTQGIMSQFGLR